MLGLRFCARAFSLVAASGGHSSSQCAGLSLSRPPLLWSTGSRRTGSVAVAHGPSCSAACGIFPDQGLNPCPPHWQADSQPLRHQGSPGPFFRAGSNCRRLPGLSLSFLQKTWYKTFHFIGKFWIWGSTLLLKWLKRVFSFQVRSGPVCSLV